MKKPKIITLCVIACMLILSACSNTRGNHVRLKLDCNEVTVEEGETFVVRATGVGDAIISATDVEWKLGHANGIIEYKNADWTKWDPKKPPDMKEMVKDIDPFNGTEFIAKKPGVAELCVMDSNSNIISDICKVTVVEKTLVDEDNEAEEAINENKSNSSVLYSKNGTTILLKNNLPTTVSYAIGGEVDSSCRVLDVSVDQESYMGIRISVECEKTYEYGEGRPCLFHWKLYDSSNVLIEEGSIANQTASIGERFKDSFAILEDLGSETYTLVFVDFK